MNKKISLIVPVFNEEDVISEFIKRVDSVMQDHKYLYEIVFVDDGSRDNTVNIIKQHTATNKNIRLIILAYNHGKEYAVTAAIDYAQGDINIYMDPDLQDPPEYIPEITNTLLEGNYDIVYGVRKNRQDSFLVKSFSYLFWNFLRKLTNLPIPDNLSVYRAFTRDFADKFKLYQEADRFIEGIFFRIGGRWTTLPIPHESRYAGVSKFNFSRRIKLAINAVLDFSEKPLILMAKFSVFIVLVSLMAIVSLVLLRFYINFQMGWPSTIVLVLFATGVQLFSLSLVGLYIGKIYKEVKRRPTYSIIEEFNLEG